MTFLKHSDFIKNNTTLLQDEELKKKINIIITEQRQEISNYESIAQWWDGTKTKIKKNMINYSINIARNERKRKEDYKIR